ncbi:MAG: DUF4956 domain-containing protein [Actinomycetota bacterium]
MLTEASPTAEVLTGLSRAGMDLGSIALLAGALFYRRHRRQDLFAVYFAFNVGLFAVLTFLTNSSISAGVGFGVFGVLSIIRLRSEAYNNIEIAYFFLALAIALVNALPGRPLSLSVTLDAAILCTMFFVDSQRLGSKTKSCQVVLDRVYDDEASLRIDLELRFCATLDSVNVTMVDYVRETTAADVRYRPHPVFAPVPS